MQGRPPPHRKRKLLCSAPCFGVAMTCTPSAGRRPTVATDILRCCGVRRVRGQPIEPAQCLPLTDEAIRGHLEGASFLGVYPLQLDETTAFLAIDLDKAAWRDDVRALSATCGALGVPHAVERSRSGNGAHLWVFFDRLIPAPLARNLGCVILTAATDRRSPLRRTIASSRVRTPSPREDSAI